MDSLVGWNDELALAVEKPDAGEQVTLAPVDGQGLDLSAIAALNAQFYQSGSDLWLVFEDGAIVVVEGYFEGATETADGTPRSVIVDGEIFTGEAFMTAFAIDDLPEEFAEGETGDAGPQQNGTSFDDPSLGDLGEGGPGLGLLNNTDLSRDGAAFTEGAGNQDTDPTLGVADIGAVDDDDLVTDGQSVFTGSLAVDFGNNGDDTPDSADLQDTPTGFGDRSITFDSADVGSTIPLTSGGTALEFVLSNGDTVLTAYLGAGRTDDDRAFEVRLFDDGAGSYRFTLFQPLDHPDPLSEDDLGLTFSFTATDDDGDSVSGTFLVNVNDDVPEIGDRESVTVDEDALVSSVVSGTVDANLVGSADLSDGNINGSPVTFVGSSGTGIQVDPTTGGWIYQVRNGTDEPLTYEVRDSSGNVLASGTVAAETRLFIALDGAGVAGQPVDLFTSTDGGSTFSDNGRDTFPGLGAETQDFDNWVNGALANDSGDLGIAWGADDANSDVDGGASDGTGDRAVSFTDTSDAAANITVNGGSILAADLTSRGDAITYSLGNDSGTLIATADAGGPNERVVFTVALSDEGSGSYDFSLQDVLDHPDPLSEDDLELIFDFTATDSDGDSVSSTFLVNVNDDVPVATGAQSFTVDEDRLPEGTDANPNRTVGTRDLGIAWGADDDTVDSVTDTVGRRLAFVGEDGSAITAPASNVVLQSTASYRGVELTEALTSDGVPVVFDVQEGPNGGQILIAYKEGGDPNNADDQIARITLDPTSDTGSYTFELLGNIDHPNEDGVTSEFTPIVFEIGFEATDSDGDSVQDNFIVRVQDDQPEGDNPQNVTFDEDRVGPNGNDFDPGQSSSRTEKTRSLRIDWGADNDTVSGPDDTVGRTLTFVDGAGEPVAAGTFSQSDLDLRVVFTGGGTAPSELSSNGIPLQFVIETTDTGGQILTAYRGDPGNGEMVFVVELDPTTDSGSYTVTLLDNIDHADPDSGSNRNAVEIEVGFQAFDADGDALKGTVNDPNDFKITIFDDQPEIGDSESAAVDEDVLVSSVVSGTVDANLVGSADLSDGNINGSPVTFVGSSGTGIQVDPATGGWIYQVRNGTDEPLTYEVRDSNGNVLASGTVAAETRLFIALDGAGVAGQPVDLFTSTDGGVTFSDNGRDTFPGVGAETQDFDNWVNGALLSDGGDLDIAWGVDDANSDVDGGASDGTGDRGVNFTDTGDVAANITVNGGSILAADLTSRGDAITYSLDNDSGTLIATADAGGPNERVVFTVTLSDDDSGSYAFNLEDVLDHPDPDSEDDLELTFAFTATDSDGDSTDGSFTVNVNDDVPVLTGDSEELLINEDDIFTFLSEGTSPHPFFFSDPENDGDDSRTQIPTGAAITNGSLDGLVDFGADGANAQAQYGFTGNAAQDMANLGLLSRGENVSFAVVNGFLPGIVWLVGYVDNPFDGTQGEFDLGDDDPIIAMRLNTETGDFQVLQFDQLDHVAPAPGTSDENTNLAVDPAINLNPDDVANGISGIDFGAVLEAIDGDDDAITLDGQVVINVLDDVPDPEIVFERRNPNRDGGNVRVDETTDGEQHSDNVFDESDQSYDQDVVDLFANVTNTGEDLDFQEFDGVKAVYARDDIIDISDSVLVGADDGAMPEYTLELILGDPDPNGLVSSGLFTTGEDDTGPGDEIFLFAEQDQTVVDGEKWIVGRYDSDDNGTVDGNDDAAFAIHIDDSNGDISIVQYVSLWHDNPDDGGFPPGSSDEDISLAPDSVLAQLSITDFDGDTRTATRDISNRITFDDDGPDVDSSNNRRIVIDDDDVINANGNPGFGNDPTDGADSDAVARRETGTLDHDFGADGGTIAWVPGDSVVTSGGADDLRFETDSNGSLLIIQEQDGSDVTIVTITLNEDTGDYTVTQNNSLIHRDDANDIENNQNFELAYRVTDGDGDIEDGVIELRIDDDTPVAGPIDNGVVAEETTAVAITNDSFEANSLASGQPGVIETAIGNYTTTAPDDWTISGQGGLYAPVDSISDTSGHAGDNVVWLRQGATLSQDSGEDLVEGANYTLSLNVGDRTDQSWPGGEVRLVAVDGGGARVVLASLTLPTPADGDWSSVMLDTGAISAANAGSNLIIEVQQDVTGGGNQVLVDNIQLTRFEPAVDDNSLNISWGADDDSSGPLFSTRALMDLCWL